MGEMPRYGMGSRPTLRNRRVLFGPMADGLVISSDREDTLTRAEYLAARGYDANGSSGAAAPNGAAEPDPPPSAAGANLDLLARSCAWCGDSLPAGAHGRARYCGARCRRAAKRARERPTAAAALPLPAAPFGAGSDSDGAFAPATGAAPAPFPAAEVGALLGLASVGAVTVERDGWRLVVHPRT
jgi:hypothetical protein